MYVFINISGLSRCHNANYGGVSKEWRRHQDDHLKAMVYLTTAGYLPDFVVGGTGSGMLQGWSSPIGSGSAVVVHDFAIETPVGVLNRNIGELTDAIRALITRIAALEERLDSVSSTPIETRRIPDDEAKQEIKSLFEERHGEVLFPSDVAEELNLEYDLVVRLLTALQREGKIAHAQTDEETRAVPRDETRR